MKIVFYPVFFACILFLSCHKKDSDPASSKDRVITSISPASARGGESITIIGKNLLINPGGLKVFINKVQASVTYSGNDSIRVIVPPKAGSGEVSIVTDFSKSIGPYFKYVYVAHVTTIAGSGDVGNNNGPAANASFKCPWGITLDNNGDIYVADSYNRLIRKIDTLTKTVTSMSPGHLRFYSPYNITMDTISKSIYVTDFNENLLKINSHGSMSVIFTDAMPLAGIGMGKDKRLYISNNTTGELISIDTAGQDRKVFSTGLITPRNIFFDKSSNMYVSAGGVYKIGPTGSVSLALANRHGFQGWETVVDTVGNFYQADHVNNCIRMIDKDQNVTIIAGSGSALDADGIDLKASFNGPMGIAIDVEGNLYVTTYNFTTGGGNKIRKISLY